MRARIVLDAPFSIRPTPAWRRAAELALLLRVALGFLLFTLLVGLSRW